MFFKKKFKKIYREKISKIKNRYKKIVENERNKFTCILNHDIKTPILAQIQTLELFLEGNFGLLTISQKEILKEVLNSNSFLLEVVSNSIFLTRYEMEKPILNLEKLDIIEQIQGCLSALEQTVKGKQQNIVLKLDDKKNKEIKLDADRKLIQKILYNLLLGSCSFGFENSDIEVSVEENKNSISVCAKNKSIYMTKEKINSLFEERKNLSDFNQLGMNLNLNIAKKLINAHNWEIIANSKQDNSSTLGFLVHK